MVGCHFFWTDENDFALPFDIPFNLWLILNITIGVLGLNPGREWRSFMDKQLKTGIIQRMVITAVMITMIQGLTACGVQPDGQSQVHVAVSGDDESGKGTRNAPYATISMAAKTNPGALILVHEGEYGPVELGPDCSGSELSPTIICAVDGERVVIQPEHFLPG